ncbi:helix-turn-helix domain-containing protein [Mammaliicoccus sciuri]|uniref:helix-turn-helix domain-containing protein n=1 Tax=Mammaliicoccus sciuri TaxID=1296 RepID=UPI00234216AF|nr:helix-turn-helix transcriptional regulator [Mammaliicoccus sciuri]MDC5693328.1 helix-turn-helix domain-containing protein [Mammaliicoccus sciuri]
MEINNKDLGRRIRCLRYINGQTQTEFGEQFNAHKSLVSKWEKGMCKPSPARLNNIAEKYKANKKWLLFGVGDENE